MLVGIELPFLFVVDVLLLYPLLVGAEAFLLPLPDACVPVSSDVDVPPLPQLGQWPLHRRSRISQCFSSSIDASQISRVQSIAINERNALHIHHDAEMRELQVHR